MTHKEPTTFRKADAGKPRFDLVPPWALNEVAAVLAFGAAKYDANNWRKVEPGQRWRYSAAALRHVYAWLRGERLDPESGCHPLAHAVCCLLFLLELEIERKP